MKEIYRLTKKFPEEEKFGMTSQLRRSCTSILANMAEGFGRFTYADKANKYTIARGECSETEAFLHMAVALEFLSAAEISRALAWTHETGKMLSGLTAYSKNKKVTIPGNTVCHPEHRRRATHGVYGSSGPVCR